MIHETAQVSEKAVIGENVKIWNWVQVRENAIIGDNTILSKSVYIDADVKIGANVKIQNNVSVYHGVTIEDGVFVGPHVCFTNDKYPRAINKDGTPKNPSDWVVSPISIGYGSSLGANSTIAPGVIIGKYALIGAGSVVVKNVPDHGLAFGNPARIVGYVCYCGYKLNMLESSEFICEKCGEKIHIKDGVK